MNEPVNLLRYPVNLLKTKDVMSTENDASAVIAHRTLYPSLASAAPDATYRCGTASGRGMAFQAMISASHGQDACANGRPDGGISGKQNNEYEGKSHDIVDNKGPIFLSHDVYDK
jgi:hypothetical protein